MKLKLAHHGSSFATRERARTLIAQVISASAAPKLVDLDVAGVLVSPSFLSELFFQLDRKGIKVTVSGADSHLASRIDRLRRYVETADSRRRTA